MNSFRRPFVFALLLLVSGLTAASAQTPPPVPALKIWPLCNQTVYGFSDTSTADALNNALTEVREDYLLLSYTVVESRCDEIEILDPLPNDPFHTTTETLCWVELRVCAIRKVITSWPISH